MRLGAVTHRTASIWHFAWVLVALLGGIQAVGDRYYMDPDSISYLNLSDLYADGDFKKAVNGYWSPAYPALLGLFRRVIQPTLYREASFALGISFLTYLGAFAGFQWFLRQLQRVQYSKQNTLAAGTDLITFQRPIEVASAVGLFLWGALQLTTVGILSPDMMLAAVVFCIAGTVLRVRSQPTRVGFLLLGVLLGIAYLTKAVMFPIGCLIALTCPFRVGSVRRSMTYAAILFAAFLTVASPQLVAMSRLSGQPSYGQVGTLAYAAKVNWYSRWWVGEPQGSGTPKHAIQRIHRNPDVFDFSSPRPSSSYPFWDEHAYWLDGIQPRFSLREQLPVVLFFSRQYALMMGSLIVAYAFLALLGRRAGRPKFSYLMLPAVAVFAIYGLVYAEGRYFGAWAVLLFLCAVSGIPLMENRRRLAGFVVALVAAVNLSGTIRDTVAHVPHVAGLVTGYTGQHLQWNIAVRLLRMGVKPGDKVGSIGEAFDGYWARLAKVQIAVEIPQSHSPAFWTSGDSVRAEVLGVFRRSGAKAVIMNRVPPGRVDPGWTPLGDRYFAFILDSPGRSP